MKKGMQIEGILMSTHNGILSNRKSEKKYLIHPHCASWPGAMISSSNSISSSNLNYLYLEQILKVPEVFELLKFDCT